MFYYYFAIYFVFLMLICVCVFCVCSIFFSTKLIRSAVDANWKQYVGSWQFSKLIVCRIHILCVEYILCLFLSLLSTFLLSLSSSSLVVHLYSIQLVWICLNIYKCVCVCLCVCMCIGASQSVIQTNERTSWRMDEWTNGRIK